MSLTTSPGICDQIWDCFETFRGSLEDQESLCWIALFVCGPSAEIYNILAEIRRGRDDHRAALSFYTKAYKVDPTNLVTLVNSAAVLHDLGMDAESINRCNEALQLYPEDIEAHFIIALSHIRLAQLQGVDKQEKSRQFYAAIHHLQKVEQLDQYFSKLQFWLGYAEFHSKLYDQAKLHLEEAIKSDPKDTRPYDLLASVYRRRGSFKKLLALTRALMHIAKA